MSPPAGIERQREMLREGSSARASGRGGGGGAARDGGIHVIGGDLEQAVGDIDGDVDGLQAPMDDQLAYDDKAVGQTAGKAASLMAQRNAAMREARSKDAGGVANQSNQLVRKLGDRWYNRIGRFWIDENVNEGTKLTVVRFGSSAYFDIASRLPELRTALAASQTVVVMVNEGHAVLISDRAGIEEFSDEQWEQTGLPKRSSS